MVARLCGRGFLPPVDTGHEIVPSGYPKGFFKKLSGDIDVFASASVRLQPGMKKGIVPA
jgi:hypothetical protein